MSELDQFEAQVRQNIKLLSSTDAKTRRKAAVWLGEAGDPNAITRLRQIYDEDPDAKVRQAAGYSLGMFRALQEAMNGDNSGQVMQLLEDIALRGKRGGRVPIPVSTIGKLMVGLLVSLAILLVFNFVIWPQFEPEINTALGLEAEERVATGVQVPLSRQAVIAGIETLLDEIQNDVMTLQAQYTAVQTGSQLDCSASFNNPVVYDINQATGYDDLLTVATALNGQLISLVTAKAPYNQACPDNAASLTGDQLVGPQASLVDLQTALAAVETDLAVAKGEQVAPTPTPETAPEPTAEAQDVSGDPGAHLTPLFTILDESRSARGMVTALMSFWEGVSSNAVASGCNEPLPTVPENYVLPEIDAQASVDLKLAVDLINNGLIFARQGWDLVRTACASGDLLNNRENGLLLANNAKIAFDTADAALNRVRESLR